MNSYKDNLTLSLKANPSVYAAITRSQGLDSKEFYDKSFSFKKLEETKKKMLFLIQIQNWKAHFYKWAPMKERGELYIKGSYLNYKSERHYFQEFHIYSSQSVLQVLVSAPSQKELKSSEPEKLFQKIRENGAKVLNQSTGR